MSNGITVAEPLIMSSFLHQVSNPLLFQNILQGKIDHKMPKTFQKTSKINGDEFVV